MVAPVLSSSPFTINKVRPYLCYKVEETLEAANNNGDLKPLHDLLKVLKKPYEDQPEIYNYQSPPKPNRKIYKTFCGT